MSRINFRISDSRLPHLLWGGLIVWLFVVWTASIFAGTSTLKSQKTAGEYVPNVVVLKFKDYLNLGESISTTGFPSFDALLSTYNITRLEQVIKPYQLPAQFSSSVGIERIYYAYFEGDRSPAEVAAALSQDAHVEYAEPKYMHYIEETPNDPDFSSQAFLTVVKAPQAWDIVKGEQGNVIIAIVDGGTDIDHPDLAANLWVNPGEVANNGLDDDNNGFVDDVNGWNFANDSNDPTGLPITPNNANHGSHTAGIACAVTNNNIGVAGVSWNARLMPVNAGSPNNDNSIAFGYDGILYAATNGADVINASWGREGTRSSYEEDVINFVSDLGAAVVAAAGNSDSNVLHFPSSYDRVLSVTATDNYDRKASFSNFGTGIDVTAPGVFIYSTVNNANYGTMSGTSMSSPLAAGIVGLVKTLHPNWLGIQASEQVRVTADNIDALNPGLEGQLGKGRVNAFRAVTETPPSIQIAAVSFTEPSGNGNIDPGESIQIFVTVKNYLAPVSNVTLTLSEDDNFVTLSTATANISSIGTLEEITATPFAMDVAANAPSSHVVHFNLAITAPGYVDKDAFTLTIQPIFGNLDVNNILTSVTNVGRLGFGDANLQIQGEGFHFKNGSNLLFEGAIIAGASADQISNAARSRLIGSTLLFDKDFRVTDDGELGIMTPGNLSDQESFTIFKDMLANNPMNIRVTQETFAMQDAPYDDFVLFRYSVENRGADVLSNFYFGLFFDWDIDGSSFSTNVTRYDFTRKMGYAFDQGNGPTTYVGMSALTDGNVSFRAIYNDQDDSRNPGWGIYDGFEDAEKWESISGGVQSQFINAGPADISFVIAQGPFVIQPNEIIQMGFALLAGEGLTDLKANADSAQSLWNQLFVTAIDDAEPSKLPKYFALEQNFPNPFNPSTKIKFSIPHNEKVILKVYDILGKEVKTLIDEDLAAGKHDVIFDGGSLPSGVYFYQIKAGKFIQTRKMLLIR